MATLRTVFQKPPSGCNRPTNPRGYLGSMWPPERTRKEELIAQVFDGVGNAAAEGCLGCLFNAIGALTVVIAAGLWIFW